MRKQPKSFVATCQCGAVVGALDYIRTPRKDAGKMLGEWLHRGCTVSPGFEGRVDVVIGACKCEQEPADRAILP